MTTEVYALLAQANLLRIRGAWQEAVDKCMAAMRIVPGNSAAQSLLGDIYENQGKFDDAIQWYRMALDSNPGSIADKAKLNRLIAIRGHNLDDIGEVPSTARPDAQLPAGVIAKSNALRATAILCGACLFGIVLTAIIQSHGSADARSHGQSSISRTLPVDPIDQRQIVSPFSNGIAARDPFEVSIFNSLRTSDGLPQDIRFADIFADPRDGRLTLTYVVRPVAALDRDSVIRSAIRAVESASSIQATGSYAYFTIRILLSADDLVTSPDNGTLIFIGDIGRSDIVDLSTDVNSIPASQAATAFTNQWWAPSLIPPAVAPAPPPAPAQPAQQPIADLGQSISSQPTSSP